MERSLQGYRVIKAVNMIQPIIFWHGSNEPYPFKSARLLKRYLPQMEEKVFDNMGHGQMLNEHPEEYGELILNFMR